LAFKTSLRLRKVLLLPKEEVSQSDFRRKNRRNLAPEFYSEQLILSANIAIAALNPKNPEAITGRHLDGYAATRNLSQIVFDK